ncbi:VOC family protein [Ornithinimicrobium faecis]|uniref:VOC family protein n=1 Tax=Ornithinimicrobium faecis TaxID=2934158 RepID=A0ABY4YQU0_9MICO|nr:VOC family protein [Ornithinimicrobium sp. HY1793]USQ78936.1 VOC family protein [Ornithinimicrobium sp. HY1793]
MITAVHTLIYSDDPSATRAFLKDVLRWPFVAEPGSGDEGRGSAGDSGSQDPADWLIFTTGPSELGVHPTGAGTSRSQRHHEIALVCDDIDATMAELSGRGAVFTSGPTDMGFGLAAMVAVPGADDILVYEARHVTAYDA